MMTESEGNMDIVKKEQVRYEIVLTEDEFIELWAHVGASYFSEIQELLVGQGRSDLVNQDLEIYEYLTDFGLEKGIIKEF